MRDKHFALIRRQLVERRLQRLEHDAARVERFGAGIVSGQCEIQPVVVFVRDGITVGQIDERLFLFLAEAVDDAVAGDAKKPRACLFDRPRQTVGSDE